MTKKTVNEKTVNEKTVNEKTVNEKTVNETESSIREDEIALLEAMREEETESSIREDEIALAASEHLVADPGPEPTPKITDEMVMTCPNCGRVNTLSECRKSKVAYRCRGCGKWLYVRVPADRTHYVRGLGETAGGNDTLDIGDETADILRGLTEVDCVLTTAEFLAKNTELWSKGFTKQVKAAGTEITKEGLVSFFTKRYADRNVGMVRMNCGNLIRGILKKIKPEIR